MTKSAYFVIKVQKLVDGIKFLLYHLAHSLIVSDEEKSKRQSLAQRASIMVQGGARDGVEDGLGADGLNCPSKRHLGRPGAPVTVLEY